MFADSVLCVDGSAVADAASTWDRHFLERIGDARTFSQRLSIKGENFDFIRHVFLGWTSKTLLEGIQKVVSHSHTHDACGTLCTPHNVPNRILFMSMLNEKILVGEDNTIKIVTQLHGRCRPLPVTSRQGYWCFCRYWIKIGMDMRSMKPGCQTPSAMG